MPRRKQQAPQRAAAYDADDPREPNIQNEDVEGEDSVDREMLPVNNVYSKEDVPIKDPQDDHDSSAAEPSGHDSNSHTSESSDCLSDFENAPVKNEEGAIKEILNTTCKDSTFGMDSLKQIKAIYSSLLTNSHRSSLNLNLTQPCTEKLPRTNSNSSSSSSSSSISSCGSTSYDWHQSAMSKTLQQVSQTRHHPAMEPSLFSTVQLYRQSTRLYGSIFTGASKFHCKDCSAAYESLVDLTVHMNETGHYRDDNHEKGGKGAKCWSKPRKRSLLEMEGKEDAQKVLRCMYCGHSFESLQDLSVHMIKTKHYQKVPLKDPVTPAPVKIVSSSRKRVPIELDLRKPLYSIDQTPKEADLSDILQKAPDSYNTTNSRYGHHQNGASYAWQFESRKFQILKCMECGSSHDSLQELTAHMMVTGHFIKVTNSTVKRVEPSTVIPSSPVQTPPAEEVTQAVPLAASMLSPSATTESPPCTSPVLKDIKKEVQGEACMMDNVHKPSSEEEVEEKLILSTKYDYLTEEDLKENPNGGLDILKSLENTVTSAINKAQTATPSWGGYQSIHAAYQLPRHVKQTMGNSGRGSPLKYMVNAGEVASLGKSLPVMSPTSGQTFLPKINLHAMEELVKKVTEKVAKVEEQMKELERDASPQSQAVTSPCSSEVGGSTGSNSPRDQRAKTTGSTDRGSHVSTESSTDEKELQKHRTDQANSPISALSGSSTVIIDHPVPEQPFVNPLSALQSVMNLHLGKAAKPVMPVQDPMIMLFKMSNSMAEKAAVAASPVQTNKPDPLDRCLHYVNKDQPIDLSKGKSERGVSLGPSLLLAISSDSNKPMPNTPVVTMYTPSSPLQENALSDISDMLRNLAKTHVSKPSTQSSLSMERSDIKGATTPEGVDEVSAQKRKGRQSHWDPRHLLILQAQFTASLRQTSNGKYVTSDLSPQGRMLISRITGLSMTTISHWLANVKYQLRRTGRTKFLKNLDLGQPVFFCGECTSQIRTPSAYIGHLESHLGFRLRDLAKLSCEQLSKQFTRHAKCPSEKLSCIPSLSQREESNGTLQRCKFCNRTFTTKHAVKLHLSKTHGKSPADHLLYVSELAKQ